MEKFCPCHSSIYVINSCFQENEKSQKPCYIQFLWHHLTDYIQVSQQGADEEEDTTGVFNLYIYYNPQTLQRPYECCKGQYHINQFLSFPKHKSVHKRFFNDLLIIPKRISDKEPSPAHIDKSQRRYHCSQRQLPISCLLLKYFVVPLR